MFLLFSSYFSTPFRHRGLDGVGVTGLHSSWKLEQHRSGRHLHRSKLHVHLSSGNQAWPHLASQPHLFGPVIVEKEIPSRLNQRGFVSPAFQTTSPLGSTSTRAVFWLLLTVKISRSFGWHVAGIDVIGFPHQIFGLPRTADDFAMHPAVGCHKHRGSCRQATCF
jgi:hypothetical protein